MNYNKKILQAMTQAPSAHNTQPWHFKSNNDFIDVFVDWDRHLDISDPTHRQLYMSIGCAIENGIVAAQSDGREVEVQYFPDGNDTLKPIARIMFLDQKAGSENVDLFNAIGLRKTNRSIFDGKPLDVDQKNKLKSLSNKHVVVVEDRKKIDELASLTSEGTFKTLARKDFKEELSHWVRSSMTKKHDGMTGDAMGLPAPLALLAPWLVKVAPIHKQEGPNAKKQMASASLVVVITANTDSIEEYLNAGRLLERIWLEATRAGLAVAVHASAVESSEELRSKVNDILGLNELPQTIVRLGHTKKEFKSSPKRTVEECLNK